MFLPGSESLLQFSPQKPQFAPLHKGYNQVRDTSGRATAVHYGQTVTNPRWETAQSQIQRDQLLFDNFEMRETRQKLGQNIDTESLVLTGFCETSQINILY